jgi:hypothetical protein
LLEKEIMCHLESDAKIAHWPDVKFVLSPTVKVERADNAVGAGAFAATGITDITKNLINFSGFPVRSEGYGSTSYGTKKEGE